MIPACGPPRSLSPLNITISGSGFDAVADERLDNAEAGKIDDASRAEIFDERKICTSGERGEVAELPEEACPVNPVI